MKKHDKTLFGLVYEAWVWVGLVTLILGCWLSLCMLLRAILYAKTGQ